MSLELKAPVSYASLIYYVARQFDAFVKGQYSHEEIAICALLWLQRGDGILESVAEIVCHRSRSACVSPLIEKVIHTASCCVSVEILAATAEVDVATDEDVD